MDSWYKQRELAKSRLAEIEDKLAQQRELLHLQNDATSLPIRLISVMEESLAHAKTHAQYIEQRIAAYEADSGRRKALASLVHVAQIEGKIAEFDRKAKALESAIQAEEDRTGIHDPAHVDYSTVAKGKIEPRDNMMRGIAALKRELADAKATLDRPRPSLQLWRS